MNTNTAKFNEYIANLVGQYPYILIDTIREMDLEKECIIGSLYLTEEMAFFKGHFQGNPIYPGVLQLMSFRQLADILYRVKDNAGLNLIKMTKIRYQKLVKPGDIFIATVRVLESRADYLMVECQATVAGHLVTKAKLEFIKNFVK